MSFTRRNTNKKNKIMFGGALHEAKSFMQQFLFLFSVKVFTFAARFRRIGSKNNTRVSAGSRRGMVLC